MGYRQLLLGTTILCSAFSTASAEEARDSAAENVLDRVMVIGTPDNISEIGGSAHYIGDEELSKHEYTDIHRVLSQVPGLNIQEEEGYGNRPNIGIRGSRNDRSSSITLMEDGVLISPAPYASPSAYYFPRVDRMSAVEVRKGSSAVKFGPRTTAGAINLVSTPVPSKQKFDALVAAGSDNANRLIMSFGNTVGNVGFVVDLGHEETDGFKKIDVVGGDTGYSIQDVMAKVKFSSDPSKDLYQELEFKIGLTQEDSDETYVGLTESHFSQDPYRRYAGSQKDNFQGDHQNFQLRHYIEPQDNLEIVTTAYRNNFARNWYKLDKVEGVKISSLLEIPENNAAAFSVLEGTTSDGSGNDLDVKANNRDYYSQGIQSVVGTELTLGKTAHDIEVGVRYHYDEESRLQHTDHYQMIDGVMHLQTAGIAGDAGNRIVSADAWALHLQDKITYDNWTVTPGLRYETIELRREDYSSSDSTRSSGPTAIYEDDVDALVSGLGVAYAVDKYTSVFGGVHQGFSPPAPPSSATDTPDIEESINFEAGVRLGNDKGKLELLGYFNDYENLLAVCTESSGGCTVGSTFNGGEVDVYGIEFTAAYDVTSYFPSIPYNMPVALSYTYTQAEFQNTFSASDFDEWGSVTAGDTVPYVAENQLYVTLGLEDEKWAFNLSGKHVGEMRTKTETQAASAGVSQGTDAHLVLDAAAEYEVVDGTRAFVTVENIFDEKYVAARRPAGLRPGKPLTFMTGVKVEF
jgi:Fe(3+) dicitrate transport protein